MKTEKSSSINIQIRNMLVEIPTDNGYFLIIPGDISLQGKKIKSSPDEALDLYDRFNLQIQNIEISFKQSEREF